jgi:ABC-type transport system involved in multi-copper enzyme maturation permease subunit
MMMLLYKTWKDSQDRFFAGVLALIAYCAVGVLFHGQIADSFSVRLVGDSYGRYVGSIVLGGPGKMVFVLTVIFLGVGGLLRERSHNTAIFTLALPVSRGQLVSAHGAIGLAELSVLAFIPAMSIPALSVLAHQSYPMGQALRYGLMRLVCGAFLFALSFLFSVVLKGAYTAPMACLFTLYLQAQVAWWRPLRPYNLNPLRTMDGGWNLGPLRNINGPLPWRSLSIMILMALVFFVAADRITQKHDL